MLLGKRPRPPMRRTTSLTEITFDVGEADAPQPTASNPPQPRHHRLAAAMEGVAAGIDGCNNGGRSRRHQQQQNQYHGDHQGQRQCHYQYQHQGPSDGLDTRYLSSLVSPRNPRRNIGDFAVEPAPFLRACGLCKRRLGPGRDTFMYRGEVAFCSLECRQQQMNQDERKERCSLTSTKKDSPPAAAASEGSVDGETVAAA